MACSRNTLTGSNRASQEGADIEVSHRDFLVSLTPRDTTAIARVAPNDESERSVHEHPLKGRLVARDDLGETIDPPAQNHYWEIVPSRVREIACRASQKNLSRDAPQRGAPQGGRICNYLEHALRPTYHGFSGVDLSEAKATAVANRS
jgi:hypothetical protein